MGDGTASEEEAESWRVALEKMEEEGKSEEGVGKVAEAAVFDREEGC